MEADRFDDVLGQWGSTRRPVLGAGLGALLGLVGVTRGEDKKKRKKKKKKDETPPPAPQCVVDTDCPPGLNCTSTGTCVCRHGGRCTGCCTNATTCRSLASVTSGACGANGATCAPCGAGLRCDTSDGQCVCDAQSNPEGCCSADRRASFPGTATNACGHSGAICASCQILEACFDQVCDRV